MKVVGVEESHNQTVEEKGYDSEDEVVEYFITWDRVLCCRGLMIHLSTNTQFRKKNGMINQSKSVHFVSVGDRMQREVYLILTLAFPLFPQLVLIIFSCHCRNAALYM